MDLKDSKTQKIVLGVLAFFIVVYFWYTRLYSTYDHQISQKAAEFEMITSDLRSVQLKAKSLDALQIEYENLISRYEEIESLLPEVKQIPSFLVQLHTASSLTGSKITRVQPLPQESVEFYNVAAFEIDITGTYHDFATFISYVANFPFIANVSEMHINATKLAVAKGKKGEREEETGPKELKKPETISATFTLSTYYVKESERLKELAF